MTGRVQLAVTGGVAEVRLNRPEKRNALDLAMFEALVRAGTHLRGEPGVRAVVLSGAGPDFCAGLDPAGEPGEIVARGGNIMLGYWNRPQETAQALRDGTSASRLSTYASGKVTPAASLLVRNRRVTDHAAGR